VGCVLMLIFMLPRFKATWTGQEVAGGQTPD